MLKWQVLDTLLLPLALLQSTIVAAQSFASPRQQHLVPLPPTERTALAGRLDPALLPHGAAIRKVDPQQVFNLVGPGGTELTVVPVVFTMPVPEAGVLGHTCGAYILPSHGKPYFLDGSPDPDQHIQCWQILAVHLQRKAGAPPDIVFTGADSLTSHSWSQDYILSRQGAAPYKLSVNFDDIP